MAITIIAALNKHGVIGSNGQLPWHHAEDLARFKQLTLGKTVLMGRRTWESLGKPLPGRRNVVFTSTPLPEVETVESVYDALALDTDLWVIGGAMLYSLFLPLANTLELTYIDSDEPGDTYFPWFDPAGWAATSVVSGPLTFWSGVRIQ